MNVMACEGELIPQFRSLKDILTEEVLIVAPKTNLLQAAKLMQKHKISCLVVGTNGTPIGIFTERDFVRAINLKSSLKTEIKGFMSQPVVTAKSSVDIYEAYNVLLKNRIRHLVVVNSIGEISGIVTQSDIMNNLTMGFFVEAKSVSKIMKRNIITIKQDELLEVALEKMVEHSISCLIVELKQRPVGILTGRDLVRLSKENFKLKNHCVKDVMSIPVLTVESSTSIFEATRIMGEKRIRRLVVVDEEGGIQGLITQSDIVSLLESRYSESVEMILSRLKEDILSNVSHELKTPVTIIKSAIQLALEEDSKEEASRLFKMALTSLERLNSIVDDLVVGAGFKTPPDKNGFDELNLSVLLPVLIADMKKEAAKKNIILQTAVPKNLPLIKGNLMAIKKAFHNILDNSIKFNKSIGGEVLITAQEIPSYIKISVSDTGIGIPPDKIDKVFAPLYQGDATTSRKYEGLGMGLTISESIIIGHGGRIWLESSLGVGTSVQFTLPVS